VCHRRQSASCGAGNGSHAFLESRELISQGFVAYSNLPNGPTHGRGALLYRSCRNLSGWLTLRHDDKVGHPALRSLHPPRGCIEQPSEPARYLSNSVLAALPAL
jgi:hypothetical protein